MQRALSIPCPAARHGPVAPRWCAFAQLTRAEKQTRHTLRTCGGSPALPVAPGVGLRDAGVRGGCKTPCKVCLMAAARRCAERPGTFGSGCRAGVCLCSLHVPRATTAGHLGPVLPDHGTLPMGAGTRLHPQQLLRP